MADAAVATMPSEPTLRPESEAPATSDDSHQGHPEAADAPEAPTDAFTGHLNAESEQTSKELITTESKQNVSVPSKGKKLQRRLDALCRQRFEAIERANLAEARLLQEQGHAAGLVMANGFLQAENQQLLIDLRAATEMISQFRAELARVRQGANNRGR
jgi:hypothetical protein